MRVALFQNLIDPKWMSLSMERYGYELRKNLEKLTDEEFSLVNFQPEIPRPLTYLPTPWRYRVSRYYYYPFFAQRHEGNINHIIDHSFAQLAQFLNKKKTIVTCHDLIPLKYLPDGTRVEKDVASLGLFQKSVSYLKEVGLVLADSQATRNDLITMLHISEDKIKVIPLGRNEAFQKTGAKSDLVAKLELPSKPLLLHVGHNLSYKNIDNILKSLKHLKEQNLPFHFIKVGPKFSTQESELIARLDLIEEITQVGFLSEKELIALYNTVDVLVYPSLFEGFGLPVLEAMSCGLRPVVSKGTSLEEIIGDVTSPVDPKDPEAIAQGIAKLLEMKPEDREILSQKLIDQAGKFSWESTADETLAAYKFIYEN